MAAAVPRGAAKRASRLDWELMPLEGVGPLRFGMRIAEVGAALPGMTEIRQFQADPGFPEPLGVEFGVGRAQPAVYAYFADGQLHCVAIDAVRGPQVTLWGRELSGCVPADLERFLLHAHRCEVLDVSYGPRGNPGVNGLGLVMRVQSFADTVLTRPVMVARAWADRRTDDWEGAIPECEWAGRPWPGAGDTESWHPPGHRTLGGGRQPPFQPDPPCARAEAAPTGSRTGDRAGDRGLQAASCSGCAAPCPGPEAGLQVVHDAHSHRRGRGFSGSGH